MTIFESLTNDYKQSLKNKDVIKSFISLVRSNILSYSKEKEQEITDDVCVIVLKQISKKLKESISSIEGNSKQEYINQLDYINQYLPPLIQGDELISLISTLKSTSPNPKSIMKSLQSMNVDMEEARKILFT